MATTKMQAPAGFANSRIQTANSGNVLVDANGFASVDSRDVAALLTAGFLIVDALRLTANNVTVTAAQVTATQAVINTGLTTITSIAVDVIRAGKIATVDAGVAVSGGNVTITSGTTYALTAGDVVNLIAAGV